MRLLHLMRGIDIISIGFRIEITPNIAAGYLSVYQYCGWISMPLGDFMARLWHPDKAIVI